MSHATSQIDSGATTATSDLRQRISAAVQRVDAVQISSDVGRLLVHWLGQHAKWATQRYGCAPEGLEDVQYALAEAVARGSDSHGASMDATLPVEMSGLVEVKAAAAAIGVKETTVLRQPGRLAIASSGLTGKVCYLQTFVVTWTLADATTQTSPGGRSRAWCALVLVFPHRHRATISDPAINTRLRRVKRSTAPTAPRHMPAVTRTPDRAD